MDAMHFTAFNELATQKLEKGMQGTGLVSEVQVSMARVLEWRTSESLGCFTVEIPRLHPKTFSISRVEAEFEICIFKNCFG